MFLKSNKNYRISLDSEEMVTPEETLLDSGSQYSDIEKPIPSSIFRSSLILFSILGFLILGFSFKNAVIDHEVFAKMAFQNKSANFPLPPPRGMIVDRNGEPLVKNIPIFNILAVTRELKEDLNNLDANLNKIAGILGQDVTALNQSVKEQMKSNSTFFVHLDLTKDQALAVEFANPRGFYVVPDTKREYLDGRKISQVIGYTGKVNKSDLADDYYSPTDLIGRLGVESEYENFLRGRHGNIFFSREESGYITREPEPGQTLMVNIDHDLQIKLYDEIFAVLRDSGLARAAGIIQDPNTGTVLALASFPDFDNNIFSSPISEATYKQLFENKSKPLFNRVISGLYNPGSTIKPLIGMAALQEHIVTPKDTIEDCVNISVPNPFDPENPYVFRNWRTEYGSFNIKKAIANSCNIYFFTVGGGHERIKGLGAEKVAEYLKNTLADSKLNIDLPGEENGFVPTPDWKIREKGEPWYLGDTYNTSIGQGDLLVTPLWLNSYIAAISNGGTIYKPQVVQKIIGRNGEIIDNFNSEPIKTLPFSQEVINEMRSAMRETTISGTAQILSDLPVTSGAKTGTAEVAKGKTVNSLFSAFAPYDNPTIVITILVEGATTQQGLAIRAAHQVLKWQFSR